MDVSSEYVKMCEKAEEIQELKHGYGYDDVVLCDRYLHKDIPLVQSKGFLWLPRQDQLQEMVWKEITEKSNSSAVWSSWDIFVQCIGEMMHCSDCGKAYNNYDKFTSMEQLWLAFLMNEKYDKVWDGEDWTGGKDGR